MIDPAARAAWHPLSKRGRAWHRTCSSGGMRSPAGLRILFRSGPAGVAFATSTFAAVLAAVSGFLDPRSLLVTIGGALGVAWVTFSREGSLSPRRYLGTAPADDFD